MDFETAEGIVNGYISGRLLETEALRVILGKIKESVVEVESEVERRVEPYRRDLETANSTIAVKEEEISTKNGEIATHVENISKLEAEIRDLKDEIAKLKG